MKIIKMAFPLLVTLLFSSALTSQARDLKTLQKDFLSWKFGMFLHFNMSTFVPGGWSTGKEDPSKFNPENLDFKEWADVAKSAKMKYAILTVKHTGGWCLWQSDSTDHDMAMFKNYKNGKGDIVREFTDAFRSRDMKVGLYYCFPLWGKCWPNYMTLPHKDYATGKIDALELIKAQFKELLTNYGKIDMVWIDQWGSTNGGLKTGDWGKVKSYIHELQPNCLVIANTCKDFNNSDIVGYEYPYSLKLPRADNTKPSEVCDKLNSGWFANPSGPAVPVRNADYLVNKMLLPLVNRNSNYLLNCSAEKTGKFHSETIELLKKIGTMWDPTNTKKYDKELYGIQTEPVLNIPNKNNMIALTLDRKWEQASREKAAEILKKYNATATFFIGKQSADKDKAELKKLVKAGHSLGNASIAEKPLNKETAMKVRDKISFIQDHLFWVKSPVAVMVPGKKYSWNIWTALNYYQLIVPEPKFVIDSEATANDTLSKISSGDIVILKYSTKALKVLNAFLGGAKEKGFKTVSIRNALMSSTSRRLKAFVNAPGAEVVTGRE